MMKVVLCSLFLFLSCAKANYRDQNSGENEYKSNEGLCEVRLPKSEVCVDLVWEKLPTQEDFGSFRLKFYEAAAPTVLVNPSITPSVILWMPSMGHGSSPVKIEKVKQGEFLVTEVYFVMSGEWEIRIQQKNGKEVIEQVALPITIEE